MWSRGGGNGLGHAADSLPPSATFHPFHSILATRSSGCVPVAWNRRSNAAVMLFDISRHPSAMLPTFFVRARRWRATSAKPAYKREVQQPGTLVNGLIDLPCRSFVSFAVVCRNLVHSFRSARCCPARCRPPGLFSSTIVNYSLLDPADSFVTFCGFAYSSCFRPAGTTSQALL